jgi:hypothetical protein
MGKSAVSSRPHQFLAGIFGEKERRLSFTPAGVIFSCPVTGAGTRVDSESPPASSLGELIAQHGDGLPEWRRLPRTLVAADDSLNGKAKFVRSNRNY